MEKCKERQRLYNQLMRQRPGSPEALEIIEKITEHYEVCQVCAQQELIRDEPRGPHGHHKTGR